MKSIRIEAAGNSWTFDQPQVIRVGREAGSDIRLSQPTVSRNHAEIRPSGDGWEIIDLGSSHGTWAGDQRVTTRAIEGTVAIRFGQESDAATATLTVEASAAAPPVGSEPTSFAPAAAVPSMPTPPTQSMPTPPITGSAPQQNLEMTRVPTGASTPGAYGGGGPGLLVRSREDDWRFNAGTAVRIGRDPSLEVVTDDSSVSRLHAVVEPRPDGWWYVDKSTGGTFLEEDRVTEKKIEEPTTLLLGHPTGGFELEFIPMVDAATAQKGIARKKRRKVLLGAGAGALVLALGGTGIAVAVLGDDDPSSNQSSQGAAGLSDAELNRAKAASVLLLAVKDGQVVSNGSGTLITDDGLILTNSHVALPSAPGQGGDPADDPDHLQVALTSTDDDTPAKVAYLARPIASDGVLDLSVVQIYADAEGNEVDPEDLDLPEPLPIGASEELRTGDEITALGYPLLAANPEQFETRELTVTRGVISTLQTDPRIGEERSQIDSDIRIGSGNSGGASINEDGELIGINSAVITATTSEGSLGEFTGGSALIRPVDFAKPIIELAEKGGDPDYVSPYFEDLGNGEEIEEEASFETFGWSREGEEVACTGTSTIDQPQILSVTPGEVLVAQYRFSGLADQTPLTFTLFSLDGTIEVTSIEVTWNAEDDGACVSLPFDAPADLSGINAAVKVGDAYVLDNPLAYQ